MYYVSLDLGTYLCRFVFAKHETRSSNKKPDLKILTYKTFVINFGIMSYGSDFPEKALFRLNEAFEEIVKLINYNCNKFNINSYKIRCVATAAFRYSDCADEIVEKIYNKFKIKVEIIDTFEEIYLAALASSALIDKKAFVIDAGSGSTEIALVEKNSVNKNFRIISYVSLNLGLVNNLTTNAERVNEFAKLKNFINESLDIFSDSLDVVFSQCNTLKIAASYFKDSFFDQFDKKHNHKVNNITFDELTEVVQSISSANNEILKNMHLIGEKKVKLMKLGLPWLYSVLKIIKPKNIKLSEFGIKEGILLGMINADKNPDKLKNEYK